MCLTYPPGETGQQQGQSDLGKDHLEGPGVDAAAVAALGVANQWKMFGRPAARDLAGKDENSECCSGKRAARNPHA